MKQRLVLLCLFFIWLATSWALFSPGFFRVHDYVHAARIAEMTRALHDGHVPVRWSANLGYGYGMPLFLFYGPLPYYVGSFLWMLGLPMILTLKVLWGGCSLVTIIGAYQVGRRLGGRSIGLVVAAAYGLAPYRALNLYVRGALGEAWGMMMIPWVVLGWILILRRQRWGWLVLTLAIAALCLSHNLTTLMSLPTTFVFGVSVAVISLYQQPWKRWWPVIRESVGAHVLGIGLAIFYIVPALVEKGYTKVEVITQGYFDYHLHFLYLRQFIQPGWGYGGSSWGPQDDISFFFGWGQWLGVIASAIVLGWLIFDWWRSAKSVTTLPTRRLLTLGVAGGLVAVSGLMTLLKSQFIWDSLPFLSFIQFPWRWLSVVSWFLAVSIALGVSLIRQTKWRWGVAGGLVAAIIIGNFYYFRPETWLADPSGFYYTDATPIQTSMSNILLDYIPKQMPKELVPPTQRFFCQPTAACDKVSLLVDRVQQRLVKTNFDQPTVVTFPIADFPGWQVELDGQVVEHQLATDGTIMVTVPAKEHLVGVTFGSTPVRQWSDTVSLISLLVLLVWVVPKPKYGPSNT